MCGRDRSRVSQGIGRGTLVLGAVREVHQFELIMSLPYNLRGCVGIGDVSDPLVAVLREDARPDLGRLHYVGQLLTCYVLEMDLARKIAKLSINPKIVNGDVKTFSADMVSELRFVQT